MADILVIEDEDIVRDALKAVLAQKGHRVLTAGDGHAGLAVLKNNAPDLVILDHHLPRARGLEVLREMRATRLGLNVVVLSGALDAESQEEYRKLGVGVLLSKADGLEAIYKGVEGELARIHEQKGGSALIVDDESQVRDLCRKSLERLGLAVREAASPAAALELLRSSPCDVVLTDIHIARGEDGADLAEEVKRRWPETDVVIMTGFPTLDTAIGTLKSGACDYLIKPFAPNLLEGVVRRCLDRRRLSKELQAERRLRQELESAYSELRKVERMKDAFLSRVNHELRTPVAIARMSFELIAPTLAAGSEKKLGQRLASALKRMQETVEEVLRYSELSHGDLSLNRAPADLWGLLEKVVESERPLWEDMNLSVALESEGERRPLMADPALLETVFTQLLLNAIRFNKKGGAVRVQASYGAREARFSFSDKGIGIEESELPKLFDAFYQAAEHLTREVGGLGLGLATVRRIIEAHGGSVSVQSRVGEGSEFALTLPMGG